MQLACARIGAVHSVVFAGFSAESLAGRILDSKPKLVVTATGSKRGPKDIVLKSIVDEALSICASDGHTVAVCTGCAAYWGVCCVWDHALGRFTLLWYCGVLSAL